MQFKRTLLIASLALTATAGIAGAASAETRWDRDHPRQDQVLDRVAHQRAGARADYRPTTATATFPGATKRACCARTPASPVRTIGWPASTAATSPRASSATWIAS
jgi:hypothetical protein